MREYEDKYRPFVPPSTWLKETYRSIFNKIRAEENKESHEHTNLWDVLRDEWRKQSRIKLINVSFPSSVKWHACFVFNRLFSKLEFTVFFFLELHQILSEFWSFDRKIKLIASIILTSSIILVGCTKFHIYLYIYIHICYKLIYFLYSHRVRASILKLMKDGKSHR